MNNKIALQSLALDLRRVAIGYHRNSLTMARCFYEEACKRKNEVRTDSLKPYLQTVLNHIDTLLNDKNDAIAENALTLSILVQNYVQTFV